MAKKQTKDQEIKDGFNTEKKFKLTRKEEKVLAKLEAKRDGVELVKNKGGRPRKIKKSVDELMADSYEILEDIRWAYKKVKGKEKVLALLEDPKLFPSVIKDFLRLEIGLVAARIRTKEDTVQPNQTVFVVLKGLEDEKKVFAAESGDEVNMRQIAGMLNPDGSEYEQ